jgi:hypothetical protein
MEVLKMKDIIVPDINYQEEIKKCMTMEDVVGKNGRKSSFDKCKETYLNGQIKGKMLK